MPFRPEKFTNVVKWNEATRAKNVSCFISFITRKRTELVKLQNTGKITQLPKIRDFSTMNKIFAKLLIL